MLKTYNNSSPVTLLRAALVCVLTFEKYFIRLHNAALLFKLKDQWYNMTGRPRAAEQPFSAHIYIKYKIKWP